MDTDVVVDRVVFYLLSCPEHGTTQYTDEATALRNRELHLAHWHRECDACERVGPTAFSPAHGANFCRDDWLKNNNGPFPGEPQ